jgi:hypothetical protein
MASTCTYELPNPSLQCVLLPNAVQIPSQQWTGASKVTSGEYFDEMSEKPVAEIMY